MAKSKHQLAEIVAVSVDSALHEALAQIPGATTFVAVARAAFSNRMQARAITTLNAIARELGAGDREEASILFNVHTGKDWFDSVLESGFREILNAIDPSAWKCIGLLVATYIKAEEAPNDAFQSVAKLLGSSTKEHLQVYARISHLYSQLVNRQSKGSRVLVQSSRKPEVAPTCWMAILDGDDVFSIGDVEPLPDCLGRAVRLLAMNGFGEYWRGFGADFKGDPMLRFEADDDNAMLLLNECVSTLREPHDDTDEMEALNA